MKEHALHFDFLLDHERLSSSPIRLRFLGPLFASVCAMAALIVWQIESLHANGLIMSKQEVEGKIGNLKTSYDIIIVDRTQEKELAAQLTQFRFYKRARNPVGVTLAQLTNAVSEKIQLTELRLFSQPVQPMDMSAAKSTAKGPLQIGPTNLFEGVNLRLAGRASAESASEVVDKLLRTLQSSTFTTLVQRAEIPKGAFRQDASGRGANRDVSLFEINCECQPRRFE